jgi:hypothetical protein
MAPLTIRTSSNIQISIDSKLLPDNGIYFFSEEGENSDHGDIFIGTHR